jgi:hypothetical protein
MDQLGDAWGVREPLVIYANPEANPALGNSWGFDRNVKRTSYHLRLGLRQVILGAAGVAESWTLNSHRCVALLTAQKMEGLIIIPTIQNGSKSRAH